MTVEFSLKMKRIEEILTQLEKSALPLEETLALYEEGQGLISQCRDFLEQTEQRVMILSENGEAQAFTIPEE